MWGNLSADGRQDRVDGAMNSGPTGSVMVSSRIWSVLALAEASSDHPLPRRAATDRDAECPRGAEVMPWSTIQRGRLEIRVGAAQIVTSNFVSARIRPDKRPRKSAP